MEDNSATSSMVQPRRMLVADPAELARGATIIANAAHRVATRA